MKHLRILLVAAFLLSVAGIAPAAAAPALSTCGPVYTVVRGDTLANIAARCGTTVAALMAANPNIPNPNRIYVGERINIPGNAPSGGTYYVVRYGDTLSMIAARFGTTVSAIMKANPAITNPDRIRVGQRLFIPSGGTPPQPPKFATVKVALIALQPAGGPQGPVGCGDSIVMVDRQITPTTAPLTAAIRELLSIRTRMYGQSGLYDPLYQANLQIQSVTIENGVARIRLTGAVNSGGMCDDPRIIAQFNATARQFSTVKQVQVYVNGTPIEQLLSGKGS